MRHAVRRLFRTPGFSAVVVACLALGIGINVALFSVVDALLLRPPSGVREPGDVRRFVIPIAAPRPGSRLALGRGFALADLEPLGKRPTVFAAVAAHRYPLPTTLGEVDPRPVRAQPVTGGWFAALGVRPALGRTLTPADDRPDAPAVAVLGDRLWQAAFGGDPGIVGRRVRLEGGEAEVVGVASANFTGLGVEPPDLWVAASRADVVGTPRELLADPEVEWFNPVVRLAPGATDARAAAEIVAAVRPRDERIPDDSWQARMPGGRFRRPVAERLTGRRSATLPVDGALDVPRWLFAATGAVLFVTCANVAGLLLARGERRRLELATRAALGAGTGRLTRDLLTESALLAAGGAAAGLVLAALLTRLVELLPRVPRVQGLEWRSALAAVALALFVTLAAGLAPALAAARADATESLKSGTARVKGARGRWRQALVAGQLAASLVLLAVGGLFVRSLRAAQNVDVGFDLRRAGYAWASLYGRGVTLAESDVARESAVERAGRVAGVTAAAAVAAAPLGVAFAVPARVPGRDVTTGGPGGQTFAAAVDHRYFATLGVPVVQGRAFTPDDRDGAPPVVMVSERFARDVWPSESPLGRCVQLGPAEASRCATVVGVAGEVRFLSAREEAPPLLYLPLAQYPERDNQLGVVVATRGDARRVMPAVRAAVQAADPRLPRVEARALVDGSFAAEVAPYRLAAWALGVFAAVALGVAAVGLYAVIAYLVAQRAGELGVRLAIGARPADVVRLVLGTTWRLAALGVLFGVPAALAATRALRGRFFGVEPWDPLTFVAVTGVLVVAALLAALLPARRAARVDPVTALRSQ